MLDLEKVIEYTIINGCPKCKLEIDKVGVVEGVDSFSVTIEQLR